MTHYDLNFLDELQQKFFSQKVEEERRFAKLRSAELRDQADLELVKTLPPKLRPRFDELIGKPIKDRTLLPRLRPARKGRSGVQHELQQVLGRSFVQDELELLDEQLRQLGELFAAINGEQRQLISAARRRAIGKVLVDIGQHFTRL